MSANDGVRYKIRCSQRRDGDVGGGAVKRAKWKTRGRWKDGKGFIAPTGRGYVLRSREGGLMGREMAFVVALGSGRKISTLNESFRDDRGSLQGFACCHPPQTISNCADQRDMAVTIFFKDASQNVCCLCGPNHIE